MKTFRAENFRARRAAVCRLGLILAVVSVAGGCPTGAYRERMAKRLETLGRGEPKAEQPLSAVVDLPGTPLRLCVPSQFTVVLVPKGSESPKRKMPPATVPGLVGTWEASVEQSEAKMPCYFYVGLVEKAKTLQDPTVGIGREIQLMWQGVDAKWQEVNDSAGRPWKRLRIEGDQDWVPLDKAGKELASRALPGMLQIDCREERGYWIIVGWRVPRSIEGLAKLDEAMAPTLGAMQIQASK